MMWFNHMPGGVASWLAVSGVAHLGPEAAILGCAPAALGSLVPDLDNPSAWLPQRLSGDRALRRSLRRIGFPRALAARVARRSPAYRVMSRVGRRLGPHREGAAHSWPVGAPLAAALVGGLALLATALLGGPQWQVVAVSAAAGAVGQVSHGLLDGVTCNCWACDPRASRTPDPGRRHVSKVDGRRLAGAAVLWPFSRRRWGLPLLTVDSDDERGAVPVLLAIATGVAAGYAMTGW
jgi:hypothetical protein